MEPQVILSENRSTQPFANYAIEVDPYLGQKQNLLHEMQTQKRNPINTSPVSMLCEYIEDENGNMVPTPFLSSFWDNIGDLATEYARALAGVPIALYNTAGQIASDPNAVKGIVGVATGNPFAFGGINGSQTGNFGIPAQSLFSNPLVLLGGIAAIYLIAKK